MRLAAVLASIAVALCVSAAIAICGAIKGDLGFIIASVVFSFLIHPAVVTETKGVLGGLRTWWFAMAFTCIGLDTNIKDLAKMDGGRPAAAFLIAQAFNIFWTLLLAWLIFGGVFFPAPKL